MLSDSRGGADAFLLPPNLRWPTTLKLTLWVCGANPSSLERERARNHQKPKWKETELELWGEEGRGGTWGQFVSWRQISV